MNDMISAGVILPFRTMFPPNQITAGIPKDVLTSITGVESAAYLAFFLVKK